MDKKIVDYMIIREGDSEFGLGASIRKQIKEGWQPFGNPYIDPEVGESQVIVKYETEENDIEHPDSKDYGSIVGYIDYALFTRVINRAIWCRRVLREGKSKKALTLYQQDELLRELEGISNWIDNIIGCVNGENIIKNGE